jgi:DNA ligase-4
MITTRYIPLTYIYQRRPGGILKMPPPPWRRGNRAPETAPSQSQEDPDLIPPPPPVVSAVERPKECINKYPTPAFALLCTMMDRLRSEEASKRRETLIRFMDLWRVKVGNDMYPLIRLLLPDVSVSIRSRVVPAQRCTQRDRERPVYNLKEALLAKCYIEVLGLDKHSEAAQRLVKWKQPVDGQVG